MSAAYLSGKVFLLITGASQGIGRQIAQSFAPLLGNDSLVLLIARNARGLQETADKLPRGLSVHTASVDLSTATAHELKDVINKVLGAAGAMQFEKAIVVHNAASIGDLTKSTVAMTDFNIWQEYYNLNVFSPAVLNGVFMEIFNDYSKVLRLVINISSYSAVQPYKFMGYYCSGKAAREMFFKVFAVENPNVNVLNYSPGPVDTDMLHAVHTYTSEAQDEDTKNLVKNRPVLTTEQTVIRLLEVLKLQKYKSGSHIDYYNN
ncbi:sepiapterin reductase-like [Neodiprion pinetum]|uniref:sepiapterin reductase-like n=1 Tax=Neodiprion pinetum TaxID=441929 RepID=UPI001EE12481|nr:sepiapterin reductase-like [Neodiprion pinetum]